MKIKVILSVLLIVSLFLTLYAIDTVAITSQTTCTTDTNCNLLPSYKCNKGLGYCTPSCASNTTCKTLSYPNNYCNMTVNFNYCEFACTRDTDCTSASYSSAKCDYTKKICAKPALASPCPNVIVNSISYLDCDANSVPDGWCGTSTAMDQNCDGTSDYCSVDADCDGVSDSLDNCLNIKNIDQKDTDKDGLGEVCDNCLNIKNIDQKNSDVLTSLNLFLDSYGDACDNCVYVVNQDQAADISHPNIGNVCYQKSSLGGLCTVTDNCKLDPIDASIGCGPSNNCISFCTTLMLNCPIPIDPCAGINCPTNQICVNGGCIDKCSTSGTLNSLVHYGDTYSFFYNEQNYALKPVILQDTNTLQFMINGVTYSAQIGSTPNPPYNPDIFLVKSVDDVNQVAEFSIACGTTQQPTVTNGGCTADVVRACPSDSPTPEVKQYSCDVTTGKLTPVLDQCELPLPQAHCEPTGITCSDENCYAYGPGGGIPIDNKLGRTIDTTTYVESPCCIPDVENTVSCAETQVTATGTVLKVLRGECVDQSGSGEGQMQVTVAGSNNAPLTQEAAQAAGYQSNVFNEDCHIAPRTVTKAPFYTPVSILLSLLFIGIYYWKKK